MKKIMLFVLIWFSLMLFGCNSQNSNNEDQNIAEEINEETIVLEEVSVVEENNTITEQVNNKPAESKPIEKPVVNNISATETLAKCLTAKWIKMYGAKNCPYCLQQEKLFGEDFKYINYINCWETPAICGNANIQWVPAWELADGSQRAGMQSLENLAAFAGCEYVW